MAKCALTGKKTTFGNNVSHSNRKTRRTFGANLQKKWIMDPFTGTKIRVTLSTRAIRTLAKLQRKAAM
ncbi:MAG: 50S ribosomal protein L28 [Candidatus Gracilibacteria bacterium]